MALKRLDHVIYHVADIAREHRRLTESFPEAWPVGRFWPEGRTSGIAIGGLNLELIQLDHPDGPVVAAAETLVFEPTSLSDADSALASARIRYERFEKLENDPQLLALRGFDPAASRVPQVICNNLLPTEPPDALPFDFFLCDYAAFLKQWLSPSHPRLATTAHVTELVYGTPEPERARDLLQILGYGGDVRLTFVEHQDRQILEIRTSAGPLPWP